MVQLWRIFGQTFGLSFIKVCKSSPQDERQLAAGLALAAEVWAASSRQLRLFQNPNEAIAGREIKFANRICRTQVLDTRV